MLSYLAGVLGSLWSMLVKIVLFTIMWLVGVVVLVAVIMVLAGGRTLLWELWSLLFN